MKYQVSVFNRQNLRSPFYYSVTRYFFSIEHHLRDNQLVSSTNDTDFDWYSNCKGENYGLKFILNLKDETGHIVNNSLTTLYLITELVYANVSVTPFMLLYHLKEKNYTWSSKNLFATLLTVTVLLVFILIVLLVVLSLYLFSYCTVPWLVTSNILYSNV